MRKKWVRKVLLRTLIACGIVFAALGIIIWVYNQEFHRWLPTHSKTNELKAAAFAASVGGELTVSLEYADGSKHVLCIEKGVHPGEPQSYSLPTMPDGYIMVRITFNSRTMKSDVDALYFYDSKELKRDGLLIYFYELYRIYIISGKTTVCYGYDSSANNWFVVANPPPIYHDPAGSSPYEWYSGWRDNKWMYAGADITMEYHHIKIKNYNQVSLCPYQGLSSINAKGSKSCPGNSR